METDIKKSTKIIERLVRLALLGGIVYFGFIFPDSFSDHIKMLHFSAHVGMSFLLASFIYVFCNIKLRINKRNSIVILMAVTLIVGIIYKYMEISGEGLLHAYQLGTLLEITGCYTSMSQNMAGILAAILLIEYASAYLTIKIGERRSY